MNQGFANSHKGCEGGGKGKLFSSWGESNILVGRIFLTGGENLRRSDFDDSNPFQS